MPKYEIKTLIQEMGALSGNDHAKHSDIELASHINDGWTERNTAFVTDKDGAALFIMRIVTLQRELPDLEAIAHKVCIDLNRSIYYLVKSNPRYTYLHQIREQWADAGESDEWLLSRLAEYEDDMPEHVAKAFNDALHAQLKAKSAS